MGVKGGVRGARLWLPLTLFAMLVVVVGVGLYRPSSAVITSKLIGQPVSAFVLPPALPPRPGVASADLRGRPVLLNFFASWCVPCAAEAPQLLALKQAGVPVLGIAIRDRPGDITTFLRSYGDPFAAIGLDDDSRVQLALGSSGVPESFVIGADGRIRLQHVGAIQPFEVADLAAAVKAAQ